MDFLKPEYRRRQLIQLYVGYVLVAIAVLLGAFVLLMVAYGFGLGAKGNIVQKGFVFVSSRPAGAEITLNGKPSGDTTNARLNIASGDYQMQLLREGYRTWQREVNVPGGEVLRLDYPLLIPNELDTSVVKTYAQAPGLITATPNNRWLLVQPDPAVPKFQMYDMGDPQAAPTTVELPAKDYVAAASNQWEAVDWAADADHLLLKYQPDDGPARFALLDRTDPSQSYDLSHRFGGSFSRITFRDGSYDQFYLYNGSTDRLATATLDKSVPQYVLSHVLAYETYGNDGILYVSGSDGQPTWLQLENGSQTFVIRQLPDKSGNYRLDIGEYRGNLYVAVAATGLNSVEIYKNPDNILSSNKSIKPAGYLLLKSADHLSFSTGNRLLVAENGSKFAVYDAEYKHSYKYDIKRPLDEGQVHATWADGAHLQYVSGGKLQLFDFDGNNIQTLVPARSNQDVYYTPDNRALYALAPTEAGAQLTYTWLRLPADR